MKNRIQNFLCLLITIIGIQIVFPQSVFGQVTPFNDRVTIDASGTLGGKFTPGNATLNIGTGSIRLLLDNNEIYSNESLHFGTPYDKNFVFRNVNTGGSEDLMVLTSAGNLGLGTISPSTRVQIVGSSNTLRISKGTGYSPIQFYSDGDGTHNNSPISISTYGYGGSQDLNFSIQNWGGFYKFKFGATGGSYDAVRITKGGGNGNGPDTGYGIMTVMGINQSSAISLNGDGNSYFNSGNVGIGTTSPSYLLDLESSSTPRIELHDITNGIKLHIGADDNRTFLQTTGAHSIDFITNSSQRMTIDESGNVGIGITNPTSKLSVDGDIFFNNKALVTARASDGTNVDHIWHDDAASDGAGGTWNFTSDGSYKQAGNSRLRGSHVYMVGTNATSYFAGKVSIGTTNSQGYQLAVDGKAIMEEVKVEMSSAWPDYVFTPSYNLQSLEEVETFINENGHLPNIPSAVEVEEENGIELGEMNAKLLEKVEELTLYMIELKKENQQQNEIIQQLLKSSKK